jgi:uncharacterized protein
MQPRAFRSGVCCAVLLLVANVLAPQEPAPMSSHERVARDLYQLSGGDKLAEAGAEAMMETFRQNPELAPYEDVFRAWIRKVFAAGDFESEMARIYMKAFTEGELLEITSFYKTPVGKKALAKLPSLMQQGAEIGRRRAQENAAELEAMLAKAKEEREQPRGLSADRAAQKRTIADIRNVGTAMFSWLTDQVSAGAAGQSQTAETITARIDQYSPISRAELVEILVPQYLQEIPETDGWGHPYEFYLNVADPLAKEVMSIRSPGRDGTFSATDYSVSSFTPDDFDEDIVWVDGFFVRWPQAPPRE